MLQPIQAGSTQISLELTYEERIVARQFLWLVLYQAKDPEYWATLALLPISMLILVLGALGAYNESYIIMVSRVIIVCTAQEY